MGRSKASTTGQQKEVHVVTQAQDNQPMSLEEELIMLDATRKVIRHEVTNLPKTANVEREASMIRVAGNIFDAFLEGRCDRIRVKIDGGQR